MRVDWILQVKWGRPVRFVLEGPVFLLCLLPLGERGRHHDTISRSARDSRTISAVSLFMLCLHLHITAAHMHRFDIENVRSLVVTTIRTPSPSLPAYNHSASPVSGDSISHDPTVGSNDDLINRKWLVGNVEGYSAARADAVVAVCNLQSYSRTSLFSDHVQTAI